MKTKTGPILPAEDSNARYRVIPGYLGRYAVGTDGSLWSLWNKGRWGGWRDAPYRLAVRTDKYGYKQASLRVDNRTHLAYVHQLVLLTFTGPPAVGQLARHRNGDPGDNSLGNLLWGTPLENADDRRRHGTLRVGSKCPGATIDEAMARRIKRLLRTRPAGEIARRCGVAKHTVFNIKYGVAWKHV